MQHQEENNLYCPNDLCQALNGQTDKFCQQCGTPMLKRYLWVVGEVNNAPIGSLWRDRYLVKTERIFLDTKPSLPPETPEDEISDQTKHYLRLIAYRLHIPQVYAVVPEAAEQNLTEILLLEQSPIYSNEPSQAGQLMPRLVDLWESANSMRQLNWLWQIAQLWQPLENEGVVSSLLEPDLLRVEGTLVRLLELVPKSATPTLKALGQMWLPWVAKAKPAIAKFLERVCQGLIQAEVRSGEQLMLLLDQGLAEIGRSQTRTFTIATRTDVGPSRPRNEDACYPPSGTIITQSNTSEGLVIVCDGIGGHEGGNVASNLAIETIQQLQPEFTTTHLNPSRLIENLENAACDANDQISRRNDSEHRHARKRMGTTLVMGLVQTHEIYITHVGDSRAYWITPYGCHQVTLDDDVASREVRLGYALYQDALQQVSSGSLVQALGMSPSASLHPTVQRFILDEDCVFLLCSDGLSDYDRVEQCWETEILPILSGKDVATVGARLVEIANTQNGHDNVTIGLLHCQVNFSEPPQSDSWLQQIPLLNSTTTTVGSNDTQEPTYPSTVLPTQVLPPKRAIKFSLPIVALGILLLGLGGLLVYLVSGASTTGLNPSPIAPPPLSPSSVATPSLNSAERFLEITLLPKSPGVKFYPGTKPPLQPNNKSDYKLLPSNTIVKVKGGEAWLAAQICSEPTTNSRGAATQGSPRSASGNHPFDQSPNSRRLELAEYGWIRQTDIEGQVNAIAPDKCLSTTNLDAGNNQPQFNQNQSSTPNQTLAPAPTRTKPPDLE